MYFFFNEPAATEISTLSLHAAIPIWTVPARRTVFQTSFIGGSRREARFEPNIRAGCRRGREARPNEPGSRRSFSDRKSTSLNSSHANTSYAVFCLKKKQNSTTTHSSH